MTSELTVLQLSRHMQLSPGDKLGPYDILVFIGAGGMSEVYRAQDVKWHRIALYGMGHASIRWCVRRRRAQLMPFMGKPQNVLGGSGLTRVWAFRR